MNSNLPIPVGEVVDREPGMPYIQTGKRRRRPVELRPLTRLTIILVAAALLLALVLFTVKLLPDGFFSFFGGKPADETTSGEETTGNPEESTSGLYEFDYGKLSEGAHAVLPCDLSARNVGVLVENRTENSAAGALLPCFLDKIRAAANDKVTVLITNTHPYEAYLADGSYEYADGVSVNANERERTVAAVADALIESLARAGIRAVYVEVPATSGRNSYQAAYEALDTALAAYPDVQYIFDLHREILLDDEGNMLRPVAAGTLGALAQLRFVAGTGEDGAVYENWEDGVRAHLALAEAVMAYDPDLVMPTEISGSRLNQHLPCTVFTVEIGTCGNSVEEAVRTADLLGTVFANKVLIP